MSDSAVQDRAEFADHVDDAGRYVRQWRYGSGHRPLMESAEGPEGFNPPFGSGEVLRKVDEVGGVAVWAVSEEAWRRAALEMALWRVDRFLQAACRDDGHDGRDDGSEGV